MTSRHGSSTAAILSCFVGAMLMAPAGASAQATQATEAIVQSQTALMRRIFSDLPSATEQKQLFDLWMADLMLTNQGPLGAIGLEESVGAGALTVLQRLEASTNADIARAATTLRTRIAADLDLVNARIGTAGPVDLTIASSKMLRFGEWDRWLLIETRPNTEYRIEARNCPVLRAVAVRADRMQGLAGGTSFGGKVVFTSPGSEIAYLRVRTPFCGTDGTVSITAGLPTIPLAPGANAAAARQGQIIEAGRTYRANLRENDQQWVRLNAVAGRRYMLVTTPDDDVLDTVLTVYENDGIKEITSDDDNGPDYGSKLEFTAVRDMVVLVKVEGLGSTSGGYDLDVTTKESPVTLARSIDVGRHEGALRDIDEQWFKIATVPGQMYVFETNPTDDLDTVLTIFEADGATEIDSDDDGGPGLGSRLGVIGDRARTLLVQVRALNEDRGNYTLTVTAGPPPTAIATEIAPGAERQGSVATGQPEQWWKINVEAGRTYVFETTPDGDFDTVITLYEANGTREVSTDDDGGATGKGSKLEYKSERAATIFLKVQGYDDSTGMYRLSVTSR